MTFSDLMRRLSERGVVASTHRVRYAVDRGKIGPVPRDGSGNFQFTERHVEKVSSYLSSPRRCGRKSVVQCRGEQRSDSVD